MAHFIDPDRKTCYLLPPSMEDWLPEDHLARFRAIMGKITKKAFSKKPGRKWAAAVS
ncbi:protein of unknown function [Acidithiobacillus ferrivorans]|uniref:Uncharacterized protein n=1 Tax=Acidithiobacillus ferrivorans TaxID=160808 RepID=A0A060ULF9_9PROT|nr:hypothetical protein [Acidithiobacillus ferrivorans]CDQ09320.1 hypothetical protein AFERRI_270001 [Acidithiobacillus ferrivorans]SMH63985.1 protein of unknown function [Acidithiobacillus ferrivorans]